MKKSSVHSFTNTLALLGLSLFSATTSPLQAAALNWNSNISDSWFTIDNWTPAALPTLADDLTINLGGTDLALVNQAGAQALSVTISSVAGSTGELNIIGPGTLVQGTDTLGDFRVGDRATGFLLVNTGGTLDSRFTVLGGFTGGSGFASVLGVGSTWTTRASLIAGFDGQGSVNVSSGGFLNSQASATLGFSRDSFGTGTVNGTGSRWLFDGAGGAVNRTLTVGLRGGGLLSVTNGALLDLGQLFVGSGDPSLPSSAPNPSQQGNGTVVVSGSGASITTNSGTFNIGTNGGTGTVTVENGGKIFSGGAGIGIVSINGNFSPGLVLRGSGTVNITGQNSEWRVFNGANPTFLRVGRDGDGFLNILNGGSVTSGASEIGYDYVTANNTFAEGTVVVSGVNSTSSLPSTWQVNSLIIGDFGNGRLTIANGGLVRSGATGTGNVDIATRAGSGIRPAVTGVLNIGTFDGASTAGTLEAATVRFRFGVGTINFNQSNTTTFAPLISGLGTVNQRSSGTTILTAANTYTGPTNVITGRLFINGSLGNTAVTIEPSATLGGTGTLGLAAPTQVTTLNFAGTLSPGPATGGIGTLTGQNLLWNPGGTIRFDLGTAGTSDLLALSGTFNGAGMGTYNIGLNFDPNDNTLVGQTFTLATFASTNFSAGVFPSNTSYQVGNTVLEGGFTLNQTNLQFTATSLGELATNFWDGTNTTANNTVDGGTAIWNNSTTNFTSSNGGSNAAWNNGTAIFAGNTGTVTLGANITFGGLTFETANYTIAPNAGNTFTLNPATSAVITTNDNATISATIAGTGSLIKEGTASLFLTNSLPNTYSGGTTINNGTIRVGANNALGSGPVVVGGGVSNEANGGALQFNNTFGAGNLTIGNRAGTVAGAFGGFTQFNNQSTAQSATFTNQGGTVADAFGGLTDFVNTSTAASATLTNQGGTADGALGGVTRFNNTATAASSSITNEGSAGAGASGGLTQFNDQSTAGSATLINQGPSVGGGVGFTEFFNSSTAGSSTIINRGGTLPDGDGGFTLFQDDSSAGSATLIAQSGLPNASGGLILFGGNSTGGTSAVQLIGNGRLAISGHLLSAVTIGSLEGDGLVLLSDSTLTIGSNNRSTTFGGTIEGNGGSLTKIGSGTLNFTGTGTYTGDTVVNAGALLVNGTIASPTTQITAGGLLGGTGTLGGNLINNGVVSPGNSPGTLTLLGNYNQSNSGTLRIEIAGRDPGQYDLLTIGGTASLGGRIQILRRNNFQLQLGDRIPFLSADGGVNGTFSREQNDFATGTIIVGRIEYSADEVALIGVRAPFVDVPDLIENQFPRFFSGLTVNQRSVASALDRVINDPRLFDLIDYLSDRLLPQLPDDFDLIAPDELTSIFQTGFSLVRVQTLNLQNRTTDIRSGATGFNAARFSVSAPTQYAKDSSSKTVEPLLQLAPDARWGVFLAGAGDWTDLQSDGNADGYDLTSGGITLGTDYRVNDSFAIGLSFGYVGTDADLVNGGDLRINGGKLALYATYFSGGFYSDLALGGGYNHYKTKRTVLGDTARGKTDGLEWNALLATGYDFQLGTLKIGPTASLQYTRVAFDGFTENGSLAPLRYEDQNADSLTTALGFRLFSEWKTGGIILRPEFRAAWQHEFADDTQRIDARFANGSGSTFGVYGPSVGRDSLLSSASLAVEWSPTFSTYVGYEGEFGRQNLDRHTVFGGLRLSF